MAAALLLAASPGTAEEGENPEPSDSLRTYHIGRVLVTAPRPALIGEPGRTEIPASVLEERDIAWAEGISSVVPATRVSVNSRGEALFNVRGAYTRHVPVYLDGIPLTIPWDERVDVSMIPLGAIGSVQVVRGVGSVGDGPNNLGGVVHLTTRDAPARGGRTTLSLRGGEDKYASGSLIHRRGAGPWSFLGAAERRTRDGFLLPAGYSSPHNQTESRRRLSSDLGQTTVLFRGARDLSRGGAIGLILSGAQAARGVPPETHLSADDARYWRIPTWRRGLIGLQTEFFPEETRSWRVDAGLSFDLFEEVIEAYPDSTYQATAEELDGDREDGWDRTGTARIRVERDMREAGAVRGFTNLRITRHRETLKAGSPVASYQQSILGLGLEWEGDLSRRWSAQAGMGYDRASTPETWDKPARDPDGAPNYALRLTRALGEGAQLHATAGRRTRFPSLRELYSEALDRFEPNPNLKPETQDTYELGGGFRRGSVEGSASAYYQPMKDGIERVSLPNRKRQRQNIGRIRTLGAEVSLTWEPRDWFRLDLQHAQLHARARAEDGDYDRRTERRPESLSYAGATFALPRSLELLSEVSAVGAGYGLDDNTGDLRQVPAWAVWNARVSWSHVIPGDRLRSLELSARVNNILDTIAYGQIGIPEPGREVRGGLKAEF